MEIKSSLCKGGALTKFTDFYLLKGYKTIKDDHFSGLFIVSLIESYYFIVLKQIYQTVFSKPRKIDSSLSIETIRTICQLPQEFAHIIRYVVCSRGSLMLSKFPDA